MKKKKARKRSIRIQAVAEEPPRPYRRVEETLGWKKARKKPTTLWLDADVVQWFKKDGPRYQTRINKVLWRVMREEKRKAGER